MPKFFQLIVPTRPWRVYQCWEAPYPLEKAIEFIQQMQQWKPEMLGEWLQLAMVRKDTGEMIGDCAFCILKDGMQAEIGMTLAKDAQGYGYGREATIQLLVYLFEELGMRRVRANCDPRESAFLAGAGTGGDAPRSAYDPLNLD